MDALRFIWDPKKARSNLRKHGVAFEEAETAFLDDHAILMFDSKHSEQEDRFLLIGMSFSLRLLLVCHCEHDDSDTIRIISARRATRTESEFYRRQMT